MKTLERGKEKKMKNESETSTSTSDGRKRRAQNNPDDPRIAMINATIGRNPDISITQLVKSYGIANKTLLGWMDRGWIPRIDKKEKHRNNVWLKTNRMLYEKRPVDKSRSA